MQDFSDVAPFLQTCGDLDVFLKEHGFRQVEALSPKWRRTRECSRLDYSSEIWVRCFGKSYQAVRIDWKGHPTNPPYFHGHGPHFHLEMFPFEDFGLYLEGATRLNGSPIAIRRFDTRTGEDTTDFKATHGPLKPV